jgi:hypothetical protein
MGTSATSSRVLAAHGDRGRHDGDVIDAHAARRLAGQLRQHRDRGVRELPRDVGPDVHAGRVDVDARHDGAQLVEGLEGHVLVDVDAAGIDDEAGLDAADVLQARARPPDGHLVGLRDDGPEFDALGHDPGIQDHRPDARDDLVETDGDARGRVVDDAHTRVHGEDIDRDGDRLGPRARRDRREVDAGPEAVVRELGGDLLWCLELDVLDGPRGFQQGAARGCPEHLDGHRGVPRSRRLGDGQAGVQHRGQPEGRQLEGPVPEQKSGRGAHLG